MNDREKEIESTADRMYTRYGTFDRAINAAEKHAGDRLPDALFWEAVGQKLRAAKLYLLGEAR
jgi:hypothetical protein